MCGIAGYCDLTAEFDAGAALTIGRRMASVMHHRGPDGGGVLVDEAHGVVLAHRRLAVVGLGDAGRQPMLSRSGRTAIVFNGEIYNFRELRDRLPVRGHAGTWRGGSDTEVILESIEAIGIDRFLAEASGMFAFVVLDRTSGTLTLARDRLGEKPLYFRHTPSRLEFGSDLDPILECGPAAGVSGAALADLLDCGFVRPPRSIYQGVEQLAPGCYVTFTRHGGRLARGIAVPYWSLVDVASRARSLRSALGADDALLEVEERLTAAVGEQLLADVPVGAFLSGGIDSSLITAIMQQRSRHPVRTFTIGFAQLSHDESEQAEAVARHLKTDHRTFVLSEDDALGMIDDVVQAYAEPFADSSQIPTYCVARLARRDITTVLTGDGGDELFGGYNRHVAASSIWPRLAAIPAAVRHGAGFLLKSAGRPLVRRAMAGAGSLMPVRLRLRQLPEKLVKAGRVIGASSIEDYHERLLRLSDPTTSFHRSNSGDFHEEAATTGTAAIGGVSDPVEHLMLRDALVYLPGDILVKLDRATMAVALEARAPLLDHRVVAAAWRLSSEDRIAFGRGKIALRRMLARHVPETLFDRPKSGFAAPLGRWLRTGLASFAERHLEPEALRSSGLLDVEAVSAAWSRHRRGAVDAAAELWPVLMYQAWRMRGPRRGPPPARVQTVSLSAVRPGEPGATLEYST